MHRGLQGGARGPGGLGRLFVRYSKLLQRRPLLTKAVTGGALNALGDSISQAVIERRYRTRIDSRRIVVFTLTGAALVSPLLHWWFGTLERMVRLPGIAGSLTKLAADQLLWAPSFVAFILSMVLILEGRPHEVPSKLRSDWTFVVKSNWKVWIPVQLLNFTAVPLQLRVLVANTAAVGWNAYLSYTSHRANA